MKNCSASREERKFDLTVSFLKYCLTCGSGPVMTGHIFLVSQGGSDREELADDLEDNYRDDNEDNARDTVSDDCAVLRAAAAVLPGQQHLTRISTVS